MEKNKGRIQHRFRLRQKLSRRTIIILAASFVTCLTIGITIFINMTRVDSSMADDRSEGVATYILEEDVPVTDMTLPAPVVKERPLIGTNTQLMRPVKTASVVPVHNE